MANTRTFLAFGNLKFAKIWNVSKIGRSFLFSLDIFFAPRGSIATRHCKMTQGKRVAIVNGIVRYVLPSSKPHADHPSHGLRVFV